MFYIGSKGSFESFLYKIDVERPTNEKSKHFKSHPLGIQVKKNEDIVGF